MAFVFFFLKFKPRKRKSRKLLPSRANRRCMDVNTCTINLPLQPQILAEVKKLAELPSLLTVLPSAHAHPRRLHLRHQRGRNQVSLCPLALRLQRSTVALKLSSTALSINFHCSCFFFFFFSRGPEIYFLSSALSLTLTTVCWLHYLTRKSACSACLFGQSHKLMESTLYRNPEVSWKLTIHLGFLSRCDSLGRSMMQQ